MKHFRIHFICGRSCHRDADGYFETDGCVTFYQGEGQMEVGCYVSALVQTIEESGTPFDLKSPPITLRHRRPEPPLETGED